MVRTHVVVVAVVNDLGSQLHQNAVGCIIQCRFRRLGAVGRRRHPQEVNGFHRPGRVTRQHAGRRILRIRTVFASDESGPDRVGQSLERNRPTLHLLLRIFQFVPSGRFAGGAPGLGECKSSPGIAVGHGPADIRSIRAAGPEIFINGCGNILGQSPVLHDRLLVVAARRHRKEACQRHGS